MNYLVAVDDCFLDTPAGMGRVAWDIALAMRGRGHRVAMLCIAPSNKEDLSPVENIEGIEIVRYRRPALPGWHPRRAERTITAGAEAAKARWSGTHWDVVHAHTPVSGQAAAQALGAGPRYVHTAHSPLVLEQRVNWAARGWQGRVKLLLGQGRLRKLEHAALSRCDAIHTLSQFMREQVQAFHGLGDRVTVIPHWRREDLRRTCSRQEARRRLGWGDDRPILFTVRRHGPRYGIDLAIRALSLLVKSGACTLVIGGDGPLRPAFQRLADELNCGDGVRFTGRLSDTDLALAYQAADLFVLPTTALECFGLIIVEALSFGCPVLSSDTCAIPEIMHPILPDFLVPAGDGAALREKAAAFLAGRLVAPTEAKLVEFVETHYSSQVIVPRITALLEGSPPPA